MYFFYIFSQRFGFAASETVDFFIVFTVTADEIKRVCGIPCTQKIPELFALAEFGLFIGGEFIYCRFYYGVLRIVLPVNAENSHPCVIYAELAAF